MTVRSVDLQTCDQEPIHLIGAIQPHGALIAVDQDDLLVRYVSQNTGIFVGYEPRALLGKPLHQLLGEENVQRLLALPLEPSQPELLKPWFIDVCSAKGESLSLECLPHRNNGHIILEFLPREVQPASVWEDEILRRGILAELIKPDALNELASVSAEIIRNVTGFDRVMIYKFAEDKHGEVIAESTVRDDSFLGLHYPASDIPDPARRHFTLNVMRSIPDINGAQIPIVNLAGDLADVDSDRPLDLTFSKLRAVAPVHVEYLNNMGVQASLSISLITNKKLWGLIACHHYSIRLLSSSRLRFTELLGGTISALLQSMENTNLLRKSIDAEKIAYKIEQQARNGTPLQALVFEQAQSIMDLASAQGLVLCLDGTFLEQGTVPIRRLDFAALRDRLLDGIATTSHLSTIVSLDEEQQETAAGAALLELSEDGSDYLVLLRKHFEHTIRWAGKPDKIELEAEDGTTRLSPRGSFSLWREERIGTSRPFDALDRDALRILRRALFALNSLEHERVALAAQKLAEAEEMRLRHVLLDAARKSSMGELASVIAHELNQPLSAVANYVHACRQELRNAGVKIPEKAHGLIDDAVTETARAGDLVRRMRNFIAQGDLNADYIDFNHAVTRGLDLALVAKSSPTLKVEVLLDPEMPRVWADPVQIGQVILNLAQNSMTAMEGMPEQVLTVQATKSDSYVQVSVRDTGRGIPKELEDSLFDPFHTSTTSGMGIGLSLCRSIVEAHSGTIWARAIPQGTEFLFQLPLREGKDEQVR